MKNELGKSIKSFDCHSALNGKRIILITAAILIFIYCLLQVDFNSVSAEFISSAVIFVLLLIITVSGFITQKNALFRLTKTAFTVSSQPFPAEQNILLFTIKT
ncbi:MAG: hypothetical protein IJZ07_07015 [Clostridia bacterium]|nr:hypothetical protein [Clostridia bacterium]